MIWFWILFSWLWWYRVLLLLRFWVVVLVVLVVWNLRRLLNNFYLSIYIHVICRCVLALLWIIFLNFFITIIVTILTFYRIVPSSYGWSSRIYYWWMLIIILLLIFLVIDWSRNHHITRSSCLSFLSSRYGRKIFSTLIVLIVCVIVLNFRNCRLSSIVRISTRFQL